MITKKGWDTADECFGLFSVALELLLHSDNSCLKLSKDIKQKQPFKFSRITESHYLSHYIIQTSFFMDFNLLMKYDLEKNPIIFLLQCS